MTDRQRRFVEEYLIDCNGAGAARRAGYAPGGASREAWRLLRIPEVRKLLDEKMQQRTQRVQIRQDAVLEELQAVAFAQASDGNGSGMKVASKLRALELLGKHLGIFEGTGGKVRETVEILEDVK